MLQKGQLCGRYNAMKLNTTAAENNSLDLLKCYQSRDAMRLASRHRALRERASASASYASSNRVLSGWPHRMPHLPQVPGEATAQGPVVPSAAQHAIHANLDESRGTDVHALRHPDSSSSGHLGLPRLSSKPAPAHTFRPATAAADFAAAAHAVLSPSRANFCPPRQFMPENARPRTCSGVPRGKLLNKTLLALRANRTMSPVSPLPEE